MTNRKFLLGAALAVGIFFLAGCAHAPEDEFAFGSSRVSCTNQTITLELPFPLGIQGAMAEAAPRDISSVSAEGHNRHMQVLVLGDAGETDMRAAAARADANIRGSKVVSGIKFSQESTVVDGREALKSTYTFKNIETGTPVVLTLEEYFFVNDGVLWQVLYQYLSDDEVGRALAERVTGQIRFGAHF